MQRSIFQRVGLYWGGWRMSLLIARYRQGSCALSDSPIGPPPVRSLAEQRNVQVSPRAPLALRDVLEPRGDEHERRLPVREGAHYTRSPANLAVQPLDGAVGADAALMLAWKARIRQGFSVSIIGPKAFLIQCYDGFGHGRPPICFLSRQLESYRGGPCPSFYLDAILLSKCAKNCTLPIAMLFSIWLYGMARRATNPERNGIEASI